MRRKPDSEPELPEWLQFAHQVQRALQQTPRGGRERKLRELADRKCLKANTVRRFLVAAEALPLVSEKTGLLLHQLARCPAASIEILGRWIRYDELGARQAASAVVRGELSVEAVKQAEKQARKVFGGPQSARVQKAEIRKIVLDTIVPAVVPPGLWPIEQSRDEEGVDLCFRDGAGHSVVVVICGPFQETRTQQLFDFAQRLLGLACIHERVIGLIMQTDEAQFLALWEVYKRRITSLLRGGESLVARIQVMPLRV